MRALLTVGIVHSRYFDCWPSGAAMSNNMVAYDAVLVPEPYQAGDTPSEMFAERHGVRALMIQYGEQPR